MSTDIQPCINIKVDHPKADHLSVCSFRGCDLGPFYVMCRYCFCQGPHSDTREGAIAAWNNLIRRTLSGVVYDGTEQTLPQKGEVVSVILYGSNKCGPRLRSVGGWAGVNHHVVTDSFCRGDMWWPLPEDVK